MKSKTYIILGIVGALLSITALADDGGRHGNNNGNNNNNQNARNDGEAFSSAVVGSSPGATIGGVASGGAPWVVSTGSAELSAAGKLEVSVTGLLLGANAPANLVGTVGPVQMVAASLICGGSGGMVAASTGGVLLNASGNASIESTLALPATCAAPIILVRIFNPAAAAGSQLGAFIAESGFNAGANATAADNDANDDHGHHD